MYFYYTQKSQIDYIECKAFRRSQLWETQSDANIAAGRFCGFSGFSVKK